MKIKAPSFADLFEEASPQLSGARRTKFLETLDPKCRLKVTSEFYGLTFI